MLAGLPYGAEPEEQQVEELLSAFPQQTVVLTGVGRGEGTIGIVLGEPGRVRHYVHKKIGTPCSGTGDLFAASFVGAWMQGKNLYQAVKIAEDFVCRCVETTVKAPAHWYGVKFEPVLPELMAMLAE